MKNFIRTVGFLILLFLAVVGLQKAFIPYNDQDTNQTATLYDLPENSIDVLFVGTSPILVGMSPLELFHETGITSQVWGSSTQMSQITYLNVKEMLKMQHPKVVICTDRSMLSDMGEDGCEPWVRRGMDYKKFSLDKMIVAKAICDQSEWQSLISYAFPILRYHSRWDSVIRDGINEKQGRYDFMHGQYPVYKTVKDPKFKNEESDNDSEVVLDETAVYWYEKLIDECHSRGIEVVFCEMPCKSTHTYARNKALSEFADAHGIYYLDYNVGADEVEGIKIKDELGIDLNRDYYDALHMNPRGSVKATDYLGKWLQETFGMKASDVSNEVKETFEEDYKTWKRVLKEKGYDIKKTQE